MQFPACFHNFCFSHPATLKIVRARSGKSSNGTVAPPLPPSSPFPSQSIPPSNSSVAALKLRQPDGGPGRNANTSHPILLCSRVSTGCRSQEPHAQRNKGQMEHCEEGGSRNSDIIAGQRKVVWAPSVASRLGELSLNPQGSETDRTSSCCLQGLEATREMTLLPQRNCLSERRGVAWGAAAGSEVTLQGCLGLCQSNFSQSDRLKCLSHKKCADITGVPGSVDLVHAVTNTFKRLKRGGLLSRSRSVAADWWPPESGVEKATGDVTTQGGSPARWRLTGCVVTCLVPHGVTGSGVRVR